METERRTGVRQPRCPSCEKERQDGEAGGAVRRRAAADAPSGQAPAGTDAVRAVVSSGGGRPLDPGTRAFFEARFGRDLGGVRVHTGAAADRSARAVNALAYAVGRDVVFRDGQYAPHATDGKRLLAHELAHTLQQSSSPTLSRAAEGPVEIGAADDPAEREADVAAERALRGEVASVGTAPPAIRRQNGPGSPAPPAAPAAPAPAPPGPPAAASTGPGAPGARRPGSERPLTREEEIAQSRADPGEITGTLDPLAVSLYGYAIADATPRPRHREAVALLVTQLAALPPGTASVVVVGHADSTGEPPFNDPLSRDRAAAITAALRESHVPVTSFGEGESHPVASNATVEGRTRNRRVDVYLNVRPPPPPERERDRERPPPPVPPPGREPGPVDPGPRDTLDRRGVCARHPVLCFLGGLGALVVIGLAAWALLSTLGSILAGLTGLGALLEGLGGLLGVLGTLAAAVGTGVGIVRALRDLGEWLRRHLPGGDGGGDDGGDDDDPREPDPEVSVTFTPVRHPDTPAAMDDRIPPGQRVPLAVVATVRGNPGAVPIVVHARPDRADAGRVLLDGHFSATITRTTTLGVRGLLPSEPRQGPLELVAVHGTREAGRGAPFYVSAIPVRMRQTLRADSPLSDGEYSAMVVAVEWESDSGFMMDLDRITVAELIQMYPGVGCFRRVRFEAPEGVPGNAGVIVDRVGARNDQMQSPGYINVQQVHVFIDERSGNTPVAMPESGYRMSLTVDEPTPTGPLRLVAEKWGQGGTVSELIGSYSSGPGVTEPPGGIEQEIAVPRQSPPPPPPPRRPPPLPPRGGGGSGPGGGGPAGGGPGTAPPVVQTRPRPYTGPTGGPAGAMAYVSGLSEPVTLGRHTLTVAFLSAGRVCVTDVDFDVIEVTTTEVRMRSSNERPLNLAPENDPPRILSPHTAGRVPLARIRAAAATDASAPPDGAPPVHAPPPSDAGLPGGR
jgi:outer membrane protein OmpA-like peptidoglycan-associated protein